MHPNALHKLDDKFQYMFITTTTETCRYLYKKPTLNSLATSYIRVPTLCTVLASSIHRIIGFYDPTAHNDYITASFTNYLKSNINLVIDPKISTSQLLTLKVKVFETYRIWGVILLAQCITTFNQLNTGCCVDKSGIRWACRPRCGVNRDESDHKIGMLFCDFHCCSCVISFSKVTG
ncbi:hypothetical protein Hanom_Chr01g00031791 [Helianthus anomalus]